MINDYDCSGVGEVIYLHWNAFGWGGPGSLVGVGGGGLGEGGGG